MPPPLPATATATSTASATANAPALKLIEEILQYLTRLINYAPGECVGCLRQLLKYLFGQNYASQVQQQPHGYHATFVRPYFVAKHDASGASTLLPPAAVGSTAAATAGATATMQQLTATQATLGALFMRSMQPDTPPAADCVRLIKLFEPLVIYCLTVSGGLLINFSSCQFV